MKNKTRIIKHVVVLGIIFTILNAGCKINSSQGAQGFDSDIKLIYVGPGSFQMGSNNGDHDEKPVCRVTIKKAYWIGKYEVTQKEYQAVMGTNPSEFKGENRPVEMVSWNDAVKFCQKLTEREHTAKRLASDCEYRLPTESEWEYAAIGGDKNHDYKYSGGNDVDSVAWFFNNSGNKTHKVGTKSCNELGIYDMTGNVWEWCNDWYSNYKEIDSKRMSSYSFRVLRGGSCINGLRRCRSTFRDRSKPSFKDSGLGFRIVKTTSKNK